MTNTNHAGAPAGSASDVTIQEPPSLRKSLKNRHIQLIALGGAIGTGLFYGSSESISLAGPAILLAYLIGGIAIFMIVRALSEMSVEDPKAGAFSYYATRYWSKRAGFVSGWNYWFNYILVSMVELSVVGSFVNYWFPNIPQWASAAFFLVVITAANLMGVSKFGEIEFWFAIIKIVAVLAMIVGGLAVIAFNLPTDSGVRASFANWFALDGGFLPNGVMQRNADGTWTGLLMALVVVMFSFGGTELIGVTAGETEDPRTTIPKATNGVIWRILVFYIVALGVIMAVVPWNMIDGASSPFVQIFDSIGVHVAAGILPGPAQLPRRTGGGCADLGGDHRNRRGGGVRVAGVRLQLSDEHRHHLGNHQLVDDHGHRDEVPPRGGRRRFAARFGAGRQERPGGAGRDRVQAAELPDRRGGGRDLAGRAAGGLSAHAAAPLGAPHHANVVRNHQPHA